MRKRVGIIVEISSQKRFLGKVSKNPEERYWLPKDGHITHCIVLPHGSLRRLPSGILFLVNVDRGEEDENVFYLPWVKILEVRTLDGRPIYRNYYLCPKCRRITKLFVGDEPFCRYCKSLISVEENKEACVSPFEEE